MLCLWILVTLELTLGSKGYHREDTFLKKKKMGFIYLRESISGGGGSGRGQRDKEIPTEWEAQTRLNPRTLRLGPEPKSDT